MQHQVSEVKLWVHLFSLLWKVVFGQDGGKGRLAVDGLRALEGSLSGNSTINTAVQVYLGSSLSGKPKVNIHKNNSHYI
jgi:hypothetical protein